MSDRYEFEMDGWDMDRPENVVYVVGLGPGDVFYLTQEAQSARVLTLAELEDTPVDMFTTVYIGNGNTRALSGRMVTPRGYRK